MPSNTNQDTRDLETKLRDLGLLEWQIRDLMPIVESTHLHKSAVLEAIGPDEALATIAEFYARKKSTETVRARNKLRAEIREKLGLTGEDHE